MLLPWFYKTNLIESTGKLSNSLKVRHQHVAGRAAQLEAHIGTLCSSYTSPLITLNCSLLCLWIISGNVMDFTNRYDKGNTFVCTGKELSSSALLQLEVGTYCQDFGDLFLLCCDLCGSAACLGSHSMEGGGGGYCWCLGGQGLLIPSQMGKGECLQLLHGLKSVFCPKPCVNYCCSLRHSFLPVKRGYLWLLPVLQRWLGPRMAVEMLLRWMPLNWEPEFAVSLAAEPIASVLGPDPARRREDACSSSLSCPIATWLHRPAVPLPLMDTP